MVLTFLQYPGRMVYEQALFIRGDHFAQGVFTIAQKMSLHV